MPGTLPFFDGRDAKNEPLLAVAMRKSAPLLLVMAQPHRIDYHPSIKGDVSGG
jgi:hypothetical protein